MANSRGLGGAFACQCWLGRRLGPAVYMSHSRRATDVRTGAEQQAACACCINQAYYAETGEELTATLTEDRASSLCYCDHGEGVPLLLAAAGGDKVTLWDVYEGKQYGVPLAGHSMGVSCVMSGPTVDGVPLLTSSSADGTIRVWDIQDAVGTGDVVRGHSDHLFSCVFVSSGHGGGVLACGDLGGAMRFWDVAGGRPVGEPLQFSDAIWLMRAASPGAAVWSAGAKLQLTDVATGACRASVPITYSSAVETCVVGPVRPGMPTLLLLRAFENLPSFVRQARTRFWDADTGVEIEKPGLSHAWCFGPYQPGQPLLCAGLVDSAVRICEVDTGETVGEDIPVTCELEGFKFARFGPIVHGGPLTLILCGGSMRVSWLQVWDVESRTMLREMKCQFLFIAISPPSPHHPTFLAGCWPGKSVGSVQIWDMTELKQHGHEMQCPTVMCLEFLPWQAGQPLLLATGSTDCAVRVWDADTCRLVWQSKSLSAGPDAWGLRVEGALGLQGNGLALLTHNGLGAKEKVEQEEERKPRS